MGNLLLKSPCAPLPLSKVLSTNQHTLPPYKPRCTPSSLFYWVAGQTLWAFVFRLFGPKPHFITSQQFCNFFIVYLASMMKRIIKYDTIYFNLTGCNSPPLGAFNALGDTPLLCGEVIHSNIQKNKKMILISTVLEELYELKGVNCSIKSNLMESSLKGKWDASGGSC